MLTGKNTFTNLNIVHYTVSLQLLLSKKKLLLKKKKKKKHHAEFQINIFTPYC